jgi:hypothetical protein
MHPKSDMNSPVMESVSARLEAATNSLSSGQRVERAIEGHGSRGTRNQERLCCRGPTAIYPTGLESRCQEMVASRKRQKNESIVGNYNRATARTRSAFYSEKYSASISASVICSYEFNKSKYQPQLPFLSLCVRGWPRFVRSLHWDVEDLLPLVTNT